MPVFENSNAEILGFFEGSQAKAVAESLRQGDTKDVMQALLEKKAELLRTRDDFDADGHRERTIRVGQLDKAYAKLSR